jgi:hypothetical protein
MANTVQMQIDGTRLRVDIPYLKGLAKRLVGRVTQGKWDQASEVWEFQLRHYNAVNARLAVSLGVSDVGAQGSGDADLIVDVHKMLATGQKLQVDTFDTGVLVSFGRELTIASAPINAQGIMGEPELAEGVTLGDGGFEAGGNTINFSLGTTVSMTGKKLNRVMNFVMEVTAKGVDLDHGISMWGTSIEHKVDGSYFTEENTLGSYKDDVKNLPDNTPTKAPTPTASKTQITTGVNAAQHERELVELVRGFRNAVQSGAIPQGMLKQMLDDAGLAYADL